MQTGQPLDLYPQPFEELLPLRVFIGTSRRVGKPFSQRSACPFAASHRAQIFDSFQSANDLRNMLKRDRMTDPIKEPSQQFRMTHVGCVTFEWPHVLEGPWLVKELGQSLAV